MHPVNKEATRMTLNKTEQGKTERHSTRRNKATRKDGTRKDRTRKDYMYPNDTQQDGKTEQGNTPTHTFSLFLSRSLSVCLSIARAQRLQRHSTTQCTSYNLIYFLQLNVLLTT